MSESYPDVWIFEENRRVYRRDSQGRAFGGPIWREHWRKLKIVDQTRVSWISDCGRKVPKRGGDWIAFSEAELDRAAYVEDNRRHIASAVLRLRHTEYEKLKAIADILGYVPQQ